MSRIKKVLLYPNPKKPDAEGNTEKVRNALDSLGIESEIYNSDRFDADAVIAIGGDGTMLWASRLAWTHGIPLLGINCGTLGYMSGLEISELGSLRLLQEELETEKRMLTDVTLIRDGEVIAQQTALNEIVLERNSGEGIASLDLSCDGIPVCGYRADGVIVATPTGSSAYALSAGGPIIDTKLDAFCVCAICPHSLTARPLVFSANSRLEITNVTEKELANSLIADGRTVAGLKCGDVVRVEKSSKTLELIRLKKDSFYEVLYRKLS